MIFSILKYNKSWIDFFRISISIYCIVSFISFWGDLPNIFFSNAFVKPEIIDILDDSLSPSLYTLYEFLGLSSYNIDFDLFVKVNLYSYLIFLLFLLIGFLNRFSALMVFILNLIITKSMTFYLSGADFFTSMALFYCFIFPNGEYTMDNLLFKRKETNFVSLKWSIRLLQMHMCIIYFFSGINKGIGKNWYNGEAVWKAVSAHNYGGVVNLSEYNLPAFIYIFIGILTLIVETFYPIFVNLKKTRRVWIFLVISMHTSIMLFMGLYFFGTIMIILNLTAYYIPYQNTEFKVNLNIKKLIR